MSAPAPQGRWLFGPTWDTLLGCGLLYVLCVALISVAPGVRAYEPGWLLPLLVILVSMPHYGGTLVRIYERRSERRAYALFAVWITLGVGGLFFWGLYNSLIASLFYTVYITWSPWHYTAQNYGISLMFLRRRGVEVTPLAKRLLYGSFLCSYLMIFVVFHGVAERAVSYSPFTYAGNEIELLSLGIPGNVSLLLAGGGAFASAGLLLAACVLLGRRGSLRALGPMLAISLTQALWFTLPVGGFVLGVRTGLVPVDYQIADHDYVIMVALAHAAQYLWVTAFYAKRSDGWHGYGRYAGKVMAAGMAVWTLPAIVFAPDLLGTREYTGGLALLIASAVNIHHFILDGAIWKLRHTRVASVLLRTSDPASESAEPPPRPWLARGVWTALAASAAVTLLMFHAKHFALPAAFRSGDYVRVGAVLDRMAWFGRDISSFRRAAANELITQKRYLDGLRQWERAVDLQGGDVVTHEELANFAMRYGDTEAAIRQNREVLRLEPSRVKARNDLAWLLSTSEEETIREPGEAVRLAESLVREQTQPDPNLLDTLAAAYAASGRYGEAIETARRAEQLASERDDVWLAEDIHDRIVLYRSEQPYIQRRDPQG